MRGAEPVLTFVLVAGCPAASEPAVTQPESGSTGIDGEQTTSTPSTGSTSGTPTGTSSDAESSGGTTTGQGDEPFACEQLWELAVAEEVEAAGAWDGFAQGYDFARGPDDAVWMLGQHERDAGGVYLAELGEDGSLVSVTDLEVVPDGAEGRELEIATADVFWIAGGRSGGPGAWIVRFAPGGSAELVEAALAPDFTLAGLALDTARQPIVVGDVADGVALVRLTDDGSVASTAAVPGTFAGGVAAIDDDVLVPSMDVDDDGTSVQGRLTRVGLDGTEVWTTPITIDAPFTGAATPTGVDILPDGAAVVAFTTLYGHPAWQFWVARVEADGTVAWVRGSYDLAGKETATLLSNALAVTDAGEILVAGTRYGSGALAAWLLALDADGDELCTYQFPADLATISRRVFWLDRAYVVAQAWNETTQWSQVTALR